MESKRSISTAYLASAAVLLLICRWGIAADDSACLECHGSAQQVSDAAGAMDLKLAPADVQRLVVKPATKGNVHAGIACLDCHPKAADVPHPAGMLAANVIRTPAPIAWSSPAAGPVPPPCRAGRSAQGGPVLLPGSPNRGRRTRSRSQRLLSGLG